ncbi:hypothetical protein [Pigmentibacter ruber]|uniref:hypothetical protein n=1 Tax=Pigmentibacter ruber TaxID=2683196 RepID=UPI00131ACFC4|nr:hypothetical protein [Pigmentibacter ruber]
MFRKVKYFLLLVLFQNTASAIELETHEIETSYPAEIRQNVISTNSYQDFNKNVGFYLDQGFYASQFGNKYIPLLSTQFGIILNNSLSIFSGLQYSVLKSSVEMEIDSEIHTVELSKYSSFNAGFGYSFFGEYYIHPKLRLSFGRSYYEVENEDFKYINNYDYFSPAISAEVNLWKFVTLEAGIQYRHIFKSEQKVSNNNFEFMFHILIGSF